MKKLRNDLIVIAVAVILWTLGYWQIAGCVLVIAAISKLMKMTVSLVIIVGAVYFVVVYLMVGLPI